MPEHRWRRRLGWLPLLALLGACAAGPQTRQLIETPPNIPPRAELTGVPFFPQLEYNCGPAALASIISYRGNAVLPEQITSLIFVPGLKGSLQIEVVAATRQFDLLPVQLEPRLESILREVAAGNPVFVLQNLGLDSLPYWHYEVVVGYDLDAGVMIMRSGVERRLLRDFAVFEKTWQRAGYWALAVVAADSIPVSATRQAYLASAIDMEQVGRVQTAHLAYASATQRWPDSLLAHTGLGNTAYELGDYEAAQNAYRQALALDSGRAELWNNLAYAMAQLGHHQQAIEAITRALDLDPDNENFRDSQLELINFKSGN